MPFPTHKLILADGKKAYFASDFHFGIPNDEDSRLREKRVCTWLDDISPDAQYIFLLGDLFDAWMEYKRVVPKGYVRFLGKLAQFSDQGINIIVFTGNHDLWMHGYFQNEMNIPVYKDLQAFQIGSSSFLLGHGDGVSSAEKKYLWLKKLLHHPVSQFIYRQLHPDLGIKLADWFSRMGPKHKYADLKMKEPDEEYQILFANETLRNTHYDYFIFGHRHIPISMKLNDHATLINLGDWLTYDTYAVFDGSKTTLKKY
ncbi:MAG: UDP-2,3-diacylglucosamine diphosphatase [Chitinophagaceae bacterium]|nr:UDP-2,3-diacylglucosamine diphosphatase [Chitinophagaceae bacterium]